MKFLRVAVSALALLSAGVASAETKLNLVNEGELRILTNPIYPPMEFVNPEKGTLDGFDVELATAIAAKLKLNPLFVTSAFQELQSGLQTGRGDVIISGMSDNVKRQESMDFVDYLTSGPILFTTKAGAEQYKQPVDLCGKTVAGSRSTSFGENVTGWSEANCVGKGRPAIKFEGTADSNAARLGMKQGRYDAVVQGIETIAYQMRVEPDTFTLVGDPLISNDTFGMGFKKDNPALRDAVAGALDKLIKDGTYNELLTKWGLVHNAVPKAVINGVK
ncbi:MULTISPECIES: ABC transporter substrate-binding protein [unclassified Ensifer]|uniref:ABC transporter substrate-binding protein n=1 Tax=unclassified Ensifer TaxID=2633371 RepID=UPI000813ACC1|nr:MULTISPECIES: ABC transporter substrate-binding protein [unclassified Ensifer]OCP18746.1 ABC transporter substrate-binding protein [Ensifer sp. LC384]OCP19741.1 ABC transporter substrate-binding protein [Ensifer sp. LC54]